MTPGATTAVWISRRSASRLSPGSMASGGGSRNRRHQHHPGSSPRRPNTLTTSGQRSPVATADWMLTIRERPVTPTRPRLASRLQRPALAPPQALDSADLATPPTRRPAPGVTGQGGARPISRDSRTIALGEMRRRLQVLLAQQSFSTSRSSSRMSVRWRQRWHIDRHHGSDICSSFQETSRRAVSDPRGRFTQPAEPRWSVWEPPVPLYRPGSRPATLWMSRRSAGEPGPGMSSSDEPGGPSVRRRGRCHGLLRWPR